jgi:hypothetical protein
MNKAAFFASCWLYSLSLLRPLRRRRPGEKGNVAGPRPAKRSIPETAPQASNLVSGPGYSCAITLATDSAPSACSEAPPVPMLPGFTAGRTRSPKGPLYGFALDHAVQRRFPGEKAGLAVLIVVHTRQEEHTVLSRQQQRSPRRHRQGGRGCA